MTRKKNKRDKLQVQVLNRLNEVSAIGKSKHEAKVAVRNENFKKGSANFHDTSPYIHSHSTLTNYKQVGFRFIKWLEDEKQISSRAPLQNMEEYVTEYLDYRLESGASIPTIKRDRAGLGKIFGKTIEHKLPTAKEITRSRTEVDRDKRFSKVNNKELITFLQATGFRRQEIEKAKKSDFYYKGDILMVSIKRSKGGKDREVMILPSLQSEVESMLSFRVNDELLFQRVHSACDVHSYRSEYARMLYKEVVEDDLRDKVVNELGFKARGKSNDKSPHLTTLKTKGREFNRDALLIVSQMLGHESIRTSVNNYLVR